MKVMKKLLLSAVTLGSFLSLAPFAFAQTLNACPQGQFNVLCFLNPNALGNLVGTGITIIFILATLAALGFLIYGGFKWITSEGDKNNVDAARQHIVAAIIGLIVIFVSYLVINLLLGVFVPGASLQNLQLPTLTR